MSLKPISLSVKRGQFRCDDPTSDEADRVYKSIRPKILKRDNHTCQFCGFRSEKYQEVHHIDDDHSNNDESNLITACPLCHACFHVGFSGQKNRGVIIRLDPALNITQAELNQLVRVLWIGEMSSDQSIKMLSLNHLARLYKQTVPADRKMGTCDAVVLGDFLLQLSDEDFSSRDKLLESYYLLPLKDGFGPQVKYWHENVFRNVPPETWLDVSTQKAQRWAENKTGDGSAYGIAEILNINQ